MQQAQFIAVDYSKLVPGRVINARDEADREEGIDELAALIKSVGLIQPLRVRPEKGGKFEIVAGNRRYAAIGRLIASGDWPKGEPVPAMSAKQDDEAALEASFVENYARRDMHPATEYEVFAKLAGEGADEETIAGRFGIKAKEVRQRLALGGLSPEILAAWRDGTIDESDAMEFASHDKALQSQAFASLRRQGMLHQHDIRRYFTKDRPSITDPRVAFVGLERYGAARCPHCEARWADGLSIDLARGRLSWPGGEVRFTPTAGKVLETLIDRPRSYPFLIEVVYGTKGEPDNPRNSISVILSRLRNDMRRAGCPVEIKTNHGHGLELVPRATAEVAA